jgi:hypothetical protein
MCEVASKLRLAGSRQGEKQQGVDRAAHRETLASGHERLTVELETRSATLSALKEGTIGKTRIAVT